MIMKLEEEVQKIILGAEARALGTCYDGHVNVVPVSTTRIIDDKIVLVNYFMGKTLKNIIANPRVSLTCWKGFRGYQVQAIAEYQTNGSIFNEVTRYVAKKLPGRKVLGVLVLDPKDIFDISVTAKTPGIKISG